MIVSMIVGFSAPEDVTVVYYNMNIFSPSKKNQNQCITFFFV